jgi:exopolysaccharide production protein ExoZ
MFFYLAFAGALLSRRGLPLLVAAFLALVAVGLAVPPSLFLLRFWSDPIILEFLIGIGLGTAYLRGVRLSVWIAIACAAAGILLALAPRIAGFGRFSPLLLLGFPAFLVCASLILSREPRRIGPFGKLLRAGGDASYSLYLSHTFTVNAVVLLWRHERLGPAWLAATAAASIAIAAAMIFYRYLEKPMIEALRRAAGERGLRGAATIAP